MAEVGTAQSLGENLSSYQNLEFFSGKSPEELKKQLEQIRLPYQILSIYAVGGAHVAWVNLTRPVKKILPTVKKFKKGKR